MVGEKLQLSELIRGDEPWLYEAPGWRCPRCGRRSIYGRRTWRRGVEIAREYLCSWCCAPAEEFVREQG